MHPRASLPLLSTIALLASHGCRSEARSASEDRRDSAGVAIVEYRGEERPLSWKFTERFRLGGTDSGPESFFQLDRSLVAVDLQAHITVLDRANYRLVQFDNAGRFRWMSGRHGGGPGEFEFPGEVLVNAEGKIAVYDFDKRALLWFDSAGASTGQTPLRHLGTPWGIAFVGDSLALGRRGPWRDDKTRLISLEILSRSDTAVVASIELLPTTSQFYESCAVSISLPPLFAPSLIWRAGFGGLVVNTEAAYVVTVLRTDGSRFSVRRTIQPVPASEAAVRRELGDSWGLGIGPSQVCPIPVQELIRKRGLAPQIPTIRDLALAPDGSVWVQRWVFPDQPAATDIFDPSGLYLGTLVGDHPFPIGFLPSGAVLAVEKDASDVQRLVVYHIGGS
jgi:hypothetical protein